MHVLIEIYCNSLTTEDMITTLNFKALETKPHEMLTHIYLQNGSSYNK